MKYNILLIFSIILGSVLNSYSQKNTAIYDSCNFIIWHSTMEADGFKSICEQKEPDYLKMFLAVKPESDEKFYREVSDKLGNEVLFLKSKIAETKKPVKALNFIFTHIQEKYLDSYDIDAAFPELFRSGRYNCLTATILYSLILEKLNYKYTPKVMPGHVYLLVYQDDKPYIFETTDPVHGFMEIDNEALRATIQSMRLFKFVQSDNSEVAQTGDLFDRYYLQLNKTDLRGLLGYHYINEMVLNSIRQEPETAYELLKKALVLTPQDELKIMREQQLRALVASYSYHSVRRAEYVAEFMSSTKTRNKNELFTNEFNLTINQCLFSDNPTPDSLTAIYNVFMQSIGDSLLKKNLEENYHYYLSTYYAVNEDMSSALNTIYKVRNLTEKNYKIKVNYFSILETITEPIRSNQTGLDNIDSLIRIYPDIAKTQVIRSKKCQIFLDIIRDHFDNNRQLLAEKYLSEFEKQFEPDDPDEIFCNPEMLYSIAGSYYFRKGNNIKARQVLNKGLEYAPENYELKMKLKQLR